MPIPSEDQWDRKNADASANLSAENTQASGWPPLTERELRVIRLLSVKGRLPFSDLEKQRTEIAETIATLHKTRGLPMLGISQRLGKSQSFLWRICRALEIETRTIGEANRLSAPSRSKHPRTSFGGTELEMAYLRGFSKGDLNVAKVSEVSLFVSTTTTHRAFSSLFQTLFSRYGHVYHYPIRDDLGRFKWKVAVRLDRSFDFLLSTSVHRTILNLSTPSLSASWLAGLVDTDGNVGMVQSGDYARCRIGISSSSVSLLRGIVRMMRIDGYTFDGPYRTAERGYTTKEFDIVYNRDHWVIILQRNEETKRILASLPLMHTEKVAMKELILRTRSAERWSAVRAKVEALRSEIASDVASYARESEAAYNSTRKIKGV